MKVRIIVEIDGRNVAEISTDELAPKDDVAQYDFEYDVQAAMLICFILNDCISGIEEIESQSAEHNGATLQ